ncbi:MAG: hypothetical protein MJ079_00770 [Ruminococcus sp.]|nr:hypothetical protein [Ruminococcus sp.]
MSGESPLTVSRLTDSERRLLSAYHANSKNIMSGESPLTVSRLTDSERKLLSAYHANSKNIMI